MRKLLTLLLILSCAFLSTAQDKKPTKEETIAFIDRTLKEMRGIDHPTAASRKIKDVSFSGEKLQYQYDYKDTEDDYFQYDDNIPWHNLDTVSCQYLHICKVQFKSKFNERTVLGEWTAEKFVSSLELFVPVHRVESFRKAVLRLAEIAREENKDPFAN